jgi:hypothetical protein
MCSREGLEMDELKEKIENAIFEATRGDEPRAKWTDFQKAIMETEAAAALRAIEEDGYEISKKQNRQYYCWNSACSATSQEQPDCICWYDQGTGPLAHESPMIWRTKKLEEPRG